MQVWDLVVIGGGSAGLTAAMEAIGTGASVAIVERSGKFGGTCRYTGCVPSKVLLHTAQTLHNMRVHAVTLGLPSQDPKIDFQRIMEHKDDVVLRAGGEDGYDAPREFYDRGGKMFTDTARFRSAREIVVGDTVLHATNVIIATGSLPRVPEAEGLEEIGYHTWESIFDLRELPESLLIVGGGPLAVEFAQMFCQFGCDVTVIEAEDEIAPKADREAAALLRELLERQGVRFICGAEVKRFRRDGQRRVATISSDGKDQEVAAAEVLVAVGTRPNTDGLGLDRAGVKLADNGAIEVDDRLRTNVAGIYACGDVSSRFQFAHVANYEGEIAARNAVCGADESIDERVVPWAIYTEPALGHVGMTEHEAQEQQIPCVSVTTTMDAIERSLLEERQDGMIKLVARRDSGVLLGAAIVGPRADDMIHQVALALQHQLTARDLADLIFGYPTYSQIVHEAAKSLVEVLDG